jgi:hypothetical protein
MSRKSQNRLRVASEIERLGKPVSVACDYCIANGKLCVAMPDSSLLKCSECVRRGRPCVNMSWPSLDKSRDDIQKKIDDDEMLLAEVMNRILRNKKLLRSVNEKAQKKAECLASELEDETEPDGEVFREHCPAAASGIGLTPAMMETMAILESMVS